MHCLQANLKEFWKSLMKILMKELKKESPKNPNKDCRRIPENLIKISEISPGVILRGIFKRIFERISERMYDITVGKISEGV